MREATLALDRMNIFDRALSGSIRSDRAPRGPLIRQAEEVVEAYMGKREKLKR